MSDKTVPEGRSRTALLIVAVCVVATLWIGTWALLRNEPDRGTFGDMFGAVNALFSGLAFLGVIYAVLLQKDELALQRYELALTRRELSGQREELAARNKAARKQLFESTFFQMISILTQIVSSIDLSRIVRSGQMPQVTSGRDCFNIFYNRLRGDFRGAQKLHGPNPPVDAYYDQFYKENGHEVGHYFRTLYNIVKFVDRSEIEDKRFYTNFVRAQLSDKELLILFYNCLSSKGLVKFKPLVEKYQLLKMVDVDQLLDSSHVHLYDPQAYEYPAQ